MIIIALSHRGGFPTWNEWLYVLSLKTRKGTLVARCTTSNLEHNIVTAIIISYSVMVDWTTCGVLRFGSGCFSTCHSRDTQKHLSFHPPINSHVHHSDRPTTLGCFKNRVSCHFWGAILFPAFQNATNMISWINFWWGVPVRMSRVEISCVCCNWACYGYSCDHISGFISCVQYA